MNTIILIFLISLCMFGAGFAVGWAYSPIDKGSKK